MRIARRKVGSFVLPWAAPAAVRLLASSWRLKRDGEEHLREVREGPAAILVLWHGSMLLPMQEFVGSGTVVLVSPSDDGDLADGLLRHFGYRTLRGSTNRGPTRALRQLVSVLGEGRSVALTPDGPRGPRHSMNAGPAWLARETGLPLLGVGAVCDRAWHLRSWDRFTIPKPFSRVVLAYTEPLRVPREADDRDLDAVIAEMRRRLLTVEQDASAGLEREPVA